MTRCLICKQELRIKKTIRLKNYHYVYCDYCSGSTLYPRKKVLEGIKNIYEDNYFEWKKPVGIKSIIFRLKIYLGYSSISTSRNHIF